MRKDWLTFGFVPLLLVSCSCSHPNDSGAAGTRDAAASHAASPAGDVAALTQGPANIAPADAATGPSAQPGQVLRLSLRDSRTKEPIYHAGLTLAGAKNLQWTDRSGRHEWTGGGFAASGSIDIRCPALRAEVGRKLASVGYALQGPLTQVDASIDSRACVEPPERSSTGAYAGTLYPYYGHGAFIPCTGMPGDAAFYGNAKAAWVNFSSDANTQYETERKAAGVDASAQTPIYVEWTGTLTGPGGYGTQIAFAYRFDATAVGKLAADFPKDCPVASLQ